MDNCIIIDWLTFSCKTHNFLSMCALMGFDSTKFKDNGGSRLRYAHRMSFGQGVSIHYTDDLEDRKYNRGCCVELSGQGCREFETFGNGDWTALFAFIQCLCQSEILSDKDKPVFAGRISRLDLAFDDFSGVVPLDKIAEYCDKGYYTSKLTEWKTFHSGRGSDRENVGLDVVHGSRDSNVMIRMYDKRVERNALEEFSHWVRLELQLRNEACEGVLNRLLDGQFTTGRLFFSILGRYLQYREPSGDSNKARWSICQWWVDLLGAIQDIEIFDKKDIEYNKDRLDRYVYQQNHNVTRSALEIDGIAEFIKRIYFRGDDVPEKYVHLAELLGNEGAFDRLSAPPGEFRVLIQRFYDDLGKFLHPPKEGEEDEAT